MNISLANAEFALTIEPQNVAYKNRIKEVKALRDEEQITLPSTIELELETNPFLRTESVEDFPRKDQSA